MSHSSEEKLLQTFCPGIFGSSKHEGEFRPSPVSGYYSFDVCGPDSSGWLQVQQLCALSATP